jgi:hypothetical protein
VACGCGRIAYVDGKPEWRPNTFCLLCTGSGWRRRIAKLDGDEEHATHDERGALHDPYTYGYDRTDKAGAKEGATPLRSMDRGELEHELARLRANVQARAGVIRNEAFGWERAHDARDRQGSYAALDRCLQALRDADEAAYLLIVRAYCEQRYGAKPLLTSRARERVAYGLAFIEARMPDRIRVPQHLADKANGEARESAVVMVFKRTNSLGATAHECGLRKARVRVLLRRAGLLASPAEPELS